MNSLFIIIIVVLFTFFAESKWIDPWFERGMLKTDKPWSTIIWGFMILALGAVTELVFELNWMLSAMFMALTMRFALFDYTYNLIHGNKLLHLGNNLTDRKKRWMRIMRFPAEGFALLVGIMQYLYFNCTINYNMYHTITFDLPRFCQ